MHKNTDSPLYFWVCPVCGRNNLPKERCACGNNVYCIRDMFPLIPARGQTKTDPFIKLALNKIFGRGL